MVVFLRTSSNCKRANHKLPKTTKITKLLVGNSTPMLSLASTNTTPHWHNKSFPRSKKLWWMYLWLWSTDSVVQVLLLMSPRLHLQNSKIIISKRILHSHIWDQGSKDLMEGGGPTCLTDLFAHHLPLLPRQHAPHTPAVDEPKGNKHILYWTTPDTFNTERVILHRLGLTCNSACVLLGLTVGRGSCTWHRFVS